MEQSAFGRLASVLFAPQKTFEAIARRPTWVLVMVVMVALIGLHETVKSKRTDVESMMREKFAAQGQMSQEQIDRQVEVGLKVSKFAPLALVVFIPAICFLFALIGWVALRVMGSEVGYIATLSTQLHASVPTLLMMLFSIVVMLGRSELSGDELIRGVLMSSPAFFVPEDGSKMMKGFLAAFDVFALWGVWLTAQGYRIVGRVSPTVAWVISIAAWLLGAVFRGVGAAFS
jgi:hypothetical protein